jgi:hypothetical protein
VLEHDGRGVGYQFAHSRRVQSCRDTSPPIASGVTPCERASLKGVLAAGELHVVIRDPSLVPP